ncbi:TPA: hypothetical protein ACPTPD_005355 [Escherichia coli]
MTNRYTLSATPLITSNAQLRWNIDASSNQAPLTLTHGRVEVCGWLLADGERSPRVAIKNDYATSRTITLPIATRSMSNALM